MDKSYLENLVGKEISGVYSLGGGSIGTSYKIESLEGQQYFIKKYEGNDNIVECEVHGLQELEKASVIKIPNIIAYNNNWIVLEFISRGKQNNEFWERFGREFAKLHKFRSKLFGFYEDNYIGATRQINNQQKNWVEFYFLQRLKYQITLAEKKRLVDSEFLRIFGKLENKIADIIGEHEVFPSLLHGDLWSGNFLIGEKGEPVLIDPAAYYGDREADLAMTKLFGGFNDRFYASYNEEFPLEDGHDYREDIYKLYHVLNHLNMFGSSYYAQALALIKNYI